MMNTRYRPGTGELVDCLARCSQFTVSGRFRRSIWRDETHLQFAYAGRSAKLCLAHLRAKHLGKQCSLQCRNSGQRAASRCGIRTIFSVWCNGAQRAANPTREANYRRCRASTELYFPSNRIRPGLNAGATAHKILRLCLAVVSGRYC
jgi:hypothetical protein